MVGPAGGLRRHLHVAARRDHRRRRSPRHPDRSPHDVRRRAVGRRRVRADPCVASPHRGDSRRPVRSATPVRDRAGDLHRRIAAVRIGAVSPDADPLESPSRSRRSHLVRNLSRTARPDVPRPRTGRCLRSLGCHHRDLDGARTDTRRNHHHRHQLARNLLGQHPRRNRGDCDLALAARRVEAPSGIAAGLGRLRDVDSWAGRPRLRPHPRRRNVLERPRSRRLAHARCRVPRCLRRRRAQGEAPDVRSLALQDPDLPRRLHRRLRDERFALRDARVPRPLSSRRPRVLGTGRRGPHRDHQRRDVRRARPSPAGFPATSPCGG